jgi:uncharacterized coiled-coil DUF342 family protein
MSAALHHAVDVLNARVDGVLESIGSLVQRVDAALARIEEVDGDRKSMRREVKDLGGKVETLHALRESIEKDAREILGARRDLIDPTKVPMPKVLKTLGYGEASK